MRKSSLVALSLLASGCAPEKLDLPPLYDPPPIASEHHEPPSDWETGPRQLAARIAWTCLITNGAAVTREVTGTFEIFKGGGGSFVNFTKDDSAVFLGSLRMQSDAKYGFLPDVSLERDESYYNAVFNFRTNLIESDKNTGFLRLYVQRNSGARLEYEHGPCSKWLLFKNESVALP